MSKFGMPDTARESRDTRAKLNHKIDFQSRIFGFRNQKTVGRLRRGNRAVASADRAVILGANVGRVICVQARGG